MSWFTVRLTSSSRRFARSNHYSHEQRRARVAQVRERIDLVAPARSTARTSAFRG